MTKYVFIIFFLFPLLSFGQNIKAGLILGINASQVDGDTYGGYQKIGLNTGVSALVPISKKFSWNIELLYNQKGSQKYPHPRSGDHSTYKLILDYADIPLLINYHDKDGRTSFGLGCSIGGLLNYKEFVNKLETSGAANQPFKKLDYNFLANANYLITPFLGFNIRFGLTFANISNFGEKKYNKLISFRLIYIINPDK